MIIGGCNMNSCRHDCSCDGGRCSMKGCTYNCSCQGGMWVIRLDVYASFISCTRTSDNHVVFCVQCMRLYLSCNGTSSTFAMVFSPTIAAIVTGVLFILMAWGAVNLYNYTTYWSHKSTEQTNILNFFLCSSLRYDMKHSSVSLSNMRRFEFASTII